jgi:ubiquinone biosynthesis protein UbiJ
VTSPSIVTFESERLNVTGRELLAKINEEVVNIKHDVKTLIKPQEKLKKKKA